MTDECLFSTHFCDHYPITEVNFAVLTLSGNPFKQASLNVVNATHSTPVELKRLRDLPQELLNQWGLWGGL